MNHGTQRRTKIIATLGPACANQESLRAMLEAGMDVARINASHGNHEQHREILNLVRSEASKIQRAVGILYDLQGPKIRVGTFEGEPLVLKPGECVKFAVGREPEANELPSDYPLLDRDVQPGDPLLIDDGKIETKVVEVKPGLVRCVAITGGAILPRKGINLPRSHVSAVAVTDKDKKDALFAAEAGVDLIALSFVRSASDVLELTHHLAAYGHQVPIIAKIEKPPAIDVLPEVLDACWGVMVARGDLGVEILPEVVPMAQKHIIGLANRAAKPVITATQMLDSMQTNLRPTRAEASDVANAVLDGSDAVMLSNETAVGAHPAHCVAMMARIIAATENIAGKAAARVPETDDSDTTPEAVAQACCQVAARVAAKAIVCFTQSGTTARLVARQRPTIPILAFAPTRAVRNQLSMVWGVRSALIESTATVDARIEHLEQALIERRLAQPGQRVVLCMAAPSAAPGSTNILTVHRVGDAARLRLS